MKLKDFINKGVYQNKALITDAPCSLWNIRTKKLISQNEIYDVVPSGDGNFIATIDNNRYILVRSYTELSTELIKKINESPDGIAIYETDDSQYRFDFIPGENYLNHLH